MPGPEFNVVDSWRPGASIGAISVLWDCSHGSQKLPKRVRPTSTKEQSSEPGPREGVGEGKSKYLRYLEDRFRDLHALRPEASADFLRGL